MNSVQLLTFAAVGVGAVFVYKHYKKKKKVVPKQVHLKKAHLNQHRPHIPPAITPMIPPKLKAFKPMLKTNHFMHSKRIYNT